jgi:hypothetical protein
MMMLLLSMAFAQEPMYTELDKGQKAPFKGYLIDHAGMDIITSKIKIAKECPVEIDYQIGLMEARKNREYELLASDYELEISLLEVEVQAQEERIHKLESLKTPAKWPFWVGLGAAVGVGTTIAIANAVN